MSKRTNSKWNRSMRDVRRNLLKIKEQFFDDLDAVMDKTTKDMTNMVWELSDQYVPEDDGDLRLSAQMTPPEKKGNTYSSVLTYGNDTVNYAYFVHENMPQAYPEKNYTRPGSGPKYLERAVDEMFTNENIKEVFLKNMREEI